MPKPEMTPTLAVLNDLTYVLECAALDFMGEGKTALDCLCDQLESNPAYALHDHVEIAVTLRGALGHYRHRDRAGGAAILSRVSRELWQRYIDGG